jgi:hypothetical protein
MVAPIEKAAAIGAGLDFFIALKIVKKLRRKT